MNILEKEVSLYETVKDAGSQKTTTIQNILDKIKAGHYQQEIKAIRALEGGKKHPDYKKLKQQLGAVSFSGTFSYRNNDSLTKYSNVMVLDLDGLELDQVGTIRSQIEKCDYTLFNFLSPGGRGFKVGVISGSSAEHHSEAYEAVRSIYDEMLAAILDTTKDLSRLCLVSYDPDLYINEKAKILEYKPSNCQLASFATGHISGNIENILIQADKIGLYEEGNRNNYIHQTACIANRNKISKQEIIDYFLEMEDLEEKDIINTVNSAYKLNIKEAGVLRYDDAFQMKEHIYIPQEFYKNLPPALQNILNNFEVRQIRDLAILAILANLSSIFYFLRGEYDKQDIYPNLYLMLIGPASTGKSNAIWGDRLISHSVKFFNNLEPKNKLHSFSISGNISSAMLYSQLDATQGRGIIFDSEGDSISQNFKNEWGDISDLLRKGFHHERSTLSRKKDFEMISIEEPKFGLAITMTPDQLMRLVKNRENGLFSRIIFYVINHSSGYSSRRPKSSGMGLKDQVDLYSEEILNMFKMYHDSHLQFSLTEDQWVAFDGFWEARDNYWVKAYGESKRDVIFRLALISYKITMVLSMLRMVGSKDKMDTVNAENEDLQMSLLLCEVLFYHALSAEGIYFKKNGHSKLKVHNEVLQIIGDKEFSRITYVKLCIEKGVSERSADRTLKKEIGASIIKIGHGVYKIAS